MSIAPAPARHPGLTPGYIFKVANAKLRRDPLILFRFISDAQRKLARYIYAGFEVLFRAGNSAGKTWCGAALAIAMLRGIKELNGIKIPDLPTPCIGWCLVQTYKGAVDGAQAALLHWIGEWPHKCVYGRGEAAGWIETLWVATAQCKHPTDEKCSTCSKLVFHCAESTSNVGGKVHFVWADEPPPKEIWDECRQRSTAKHLLVRYITATPKEKRWWWWMPADFHDCLDKPRDGFVEIRSSVHDNRALAPEVLKQKLQAAEKDQRPRAVIYGDYVDMKGECPFPPEKLEVWLKRCRPPTRVAEITVTAERRTPEGDVMVPVRCRVQIFHEFEPEETYLGVLDSGTFLRLDSSGLVASDWTREGSSSRGVPDPCGAHIYARRKPRLVVRFSGYCGGHGLGSLGAKLSQQCHEATGQDILLDTDLTGGHGDPVVRALTAAGHFRLHNYNMIVTQPGQTTMGLGFKMNAQNRAEMVAAIQQALLDDSLLCESEDAVRSLMEVTYVMTPSGRERPEAGYGAKDEDMICMGRALHLMNTLPLPVLAASAREDRFRRWLGVDLNRRRAGLHPKVRWNPR